MRAIWRSLLPRGPRGGEGRRTDTDFALLRAMQKVRGKLEDALAEA